MNWDAALGELDNPVAAAAQDIASRGTKVRQRKRQKVARTKRDDIQGLRSVAVVLVVLFHAGVTALPGGYIGVDVFFVISGFLITGNIVRTLESDDFTLLGFYANRARRLLPAAFVTIAVTCLLTYLLLPTTRFNSIAHDALSSAYYAINWRLSQQSVDYLAQNDAASPFQHFWSLAVEEQYYLVWPLLLLIAAALVRRAARTSRLSRVPSKRRHTAFVVALLVILVPSFAYSIAYTASDAAQAYFVTTTRMWELALGGAVALSARRLMGIPPWAAVALGWAGLAAIVGSAFVYTGATPFPGYAAALPTAGAAAVIAAGPRAGPAGAALLLNHRVPVAIGDISYSLYLWHWPLIVVAAAQFDGPLPLWAGLAAAGAALVPAWLSYLFVEQPGMHALSFASTRAGLSLGLVTSLSGAVAALLLLAFIPATRASSVVVADNGQAVDVITGKQLKVGAEILGLHPAGNKAGAPKDRFESITPSPSEAKFDAPDEGKCITLITVGSDQSCIFGDRSSTTIVELVGDSHAMQWLPALEEVAGRRHWKIITHTKQSCPFNAATLFRQQEKGAYEECTQWNANVSKSILYERPALVLTSSIRDTAAWVDGKPLNVDASQPILTKGYEDAWAPLLAAGIKVAAIAGTPVPLVDVPACVSTHRDELRKCALPRSAILPPNDASHRAAKATAASWIDLNDAVCPTTRCAAVIGSVLVYRDVNHLTATYVSTMATIFASRIVPLVNG